MILDFTCTGMRRPEIWQQTLVTFTRNLRSVDLGASTLYLNVDPMPVDRYDADGMRALAGEFFGNVVLNAPSESNFTRAVKWCWLQPKGQAFFHLEDDWSLDQPVDVIDLLALLTSDPGISLVNLRAYAHDDDRLCLAPGLWRTIAAQTIARRLRDDANPERQLRPVRQNNPHGGAHEGFRGVQFPRAKRERVIHDLGREWMRKNKLQRDGGVQFTRWISRA
jgi:hypothetical protein